MVCVQSRETPKDFTSFLGKQQIPKFVQQLCFILNHKNYNFFNCDLFDHLYDYKLNWMTQSPVTN